MMIDLHVHTNCSDGTLTPSELVKRAALKEVTTVAITDHDTIAGNAEALEEGARLGVEVIPGVEVSIKIGEVGVHLLGYGLDFTTPRGLAAFNRLALAREERLVRMVSRLNELGAPITSKEVKQLAGGEVIGRLHIAKVMVRRGFVPNLQAAFTQYLGKRGLAYVDRERLTPIGAIEVIRGMGGVAVMAHPGVLERELGEFPEEVVKELQELGMGGIESYYSRHSEEQTDAFNELAAKLWLFTTGGSDFHSPNPDGIELGRGYGDMRVPESCLFNLKEAIAKTRN
ncbi:MAG: phosphoesterase [Deltaproteobacteria bacterium]|nr:MAG: phosphoesterase [Deltaproteobacteria bacterium]